MINFITRNCPCCNSNKLDHNIIQSPINPEDLSFTELKNFWNGFFKDKVIFSYRRCSDCGLLYCPKFFSTSSLSKLYEQMSPNMDDVPINSLKKTQQGYFNFLKQYSNLSGEFLEIGPDIGLFTQSCVDYGKFSKFWLFEPNVLVTEKLKKVLDGKKSIIHKKMFDFKIIPNNSINVAVAIHVMDHLPDPVSLLKELKFKLKPGSRLLIVTHDEFSLLRILFNWRWPAFCLQHPQIYNKDSTKKILQKAGFSVITQRKTTNYFKLNFLFKHLLWALGLKVKTVPNFWNLSIGLKLGNILTIASVDDKHEKYE